MCAEANETLRGVRFFGYTLRVGPIGRIPPLQDAAGVETSGIPETSRNLQPAVMPLGPSDHRHLVGTKVETHRVALRDPMAADLPEAVNVSTGRFGIITRQTPAQVIQTAGAGPCVIVVLHDATHGVAALAHFFPNQDPARSVAAMVQAARQAGLDPKRTVAHVAGGLDAAPNLPPRILEALAPYGFTAGERDLLGRDVRNLQFHLRSGRIERYSEQGNDRAPEPHDQPVAALQRHPRAWRP